MIMTIIVLATVFLVGLLYFEKKQNPKGLIPTKTILSLLFIVAAVSQVRLLQPYTLLVIVGLLFCLGGDVFLAIPRERMFLFGLISFLIGHVCYVGAFFWIAHINRFTLAGAIVAVIFSSMIYIWLKPHLGAMKKPVIVYILVISLMLCGAWSVMDASFQSFFGRLLVFIGAFSFYVSDIFVARDRFVKTSFVNRLFGLPLYYAGQFMIAFSVGMMR
jgi:uncharacterized membrane protein YhhN